MVLAATTSANGINNALYQLEDTVQDAEGNIYRTVTIGDQVWLAEGLRSTRFQDGSAVRSGVIPNDDEANLLKYGRLYNWHDVADERNLCPEGWSGGDQDIGLQLKEAQTDGPFKKVDQSLVNKHKFFARPAGVKWNGFYITEGAYTEFWTADSASDSKGFIRTLAYSWWNSHKGEIRRATSSKEYMFSVRCVRI